MAKTNKILTIPEPGKVVLEEKPYPRIKIGYALVKVHIAPICGEYKSYKDHSFAVWYDQDHLGHEGVGEIEEVAPGSRFKVGDRVIIYQGHSCGGTCFVCRRGLSPTLCMNMPFEFISYRVTKSHDPIDALDGRPTMEAEGGLKAIEIACGSESGGFGFSQYRIAPEDMLQKIPDELSYKHAAVANCALGCTYTAVEEFGVRAGDWVLVAGIGFTGLGTIVNAKYRGAKVIALGRNEYRMDLARKLGADRIIDPDDPNWLAQIHELTGDLKGVDACFECSGYPFYQYKCLDAVRRYGKVYILGGMGTEEPLAINLLDHIMNRHVWLTGGHDVRFKDREGILRMLLDPKIQEQIDIMVTHELPMSKAKDAFEAALRRESGKMYLLPWE